MIIKYRRHSRRILETRAWPALIGVLRTEKDSSVMTISLWLLVLLLPHVAGVLEQVLIDILYILKRCLLPVKIHNNTNNKKNHTVQYTILLLL